MVNFVNFIVLALALASPATAFPAHGSLAGLPRDVLERIIPTLQLRHPGSPPGPLKFNGTKLVNDEQHPWKALRDGDTRGPCPGLNTLASHGWLPRSGIATPVQIINAVQEGFNMENSLARFLAYAAHLVDGNLITDQLSIGGKTSKTGPDPPPPATVGGLDTHAVFEGDASLTRGDFFFGDNHSFNETLFDKLAAFSNKYGAGKYNYTVAGELRWQRIQDSIATNPTFSFVSPRYFTAYAETTFPVNFFIDGRQGDGQLDLDVARGFFQNMRMPDDFHRASQPMSGDGEDIVVNVHPIPPGRNVGGVNNYVPDPTSANFTTTCLLYQNFVNQTIRGLYPKPAEALVKALNTNLDFLYEAFGDATCAQVFPYGQD
ncbi:aromatic peroxygenase precursor [Macrolepiota fuliginosa MF-IS2]|uniref:Aromatic peroxygenase n=1 Tax=Macrolepiota fuliginosa MF-IS2 TaxID=1400762 RepID=A0A9P5X738_9AGAR|nr:aromatic peroxygenase precursor [Macrolepiota fuliginosa MF-IS2]